MKEVIPASDSERQKWKEDAELGFVRPFQGHYITDKTVVFKILRLIALIEEQENTIIEMKDQLEIINDD